MDPEVQKLFTELDAKIVRRTHRRAPAGFYDRRVRYDADPRKVLSTALSRAQVFVPLYSPLYLVKSWPRREQNAFRNRMMQQHQDPDSRVLPVLWTPVPPWTSDAEDRRSLKQARALVPDVPEYRENGLRALCLLPIYADAYRRVLDHVADRIIHTAETAPVPPVDALDLDQVPDRPADEPSFIITVLTGRPEAAPRSPWHPYLGRLNVPVAEYAVQTAERASLAPLVVAFGRLAYYSVNNPALVFVDPRILQHPSGEEHLRQAFQCLPIWVRPLVVGDDNDTTVDALTTRAQELLSRSVPASCRLPTRAVERIDGPKDLEAKLPFALAKTRQAYLRYGIYDSPPSPAPRPRLTSSDDDPSSGQESNDNR